MKRAILVLLIISVLFCVACSDEKDNKHTFNDYFKAEELELLKLDGIPLFDAEPMKVYDDGVTLLYEELSREEVEEYADKLFTALKTKGLTVYKAVYPESGGVPTAFVPTEALPEAYVKSNELAYNIVYSDGESYFAAMIRHCTVTHDQTLVGDTAVVVENQTKSIKPLIKTEG